MFSPSVIIISDCEELPDGLAVVMGSQQSVWNTSLVVGSPASSASVALCGGTIYTTSSTPRSTWEGMWSSRSDRPATDRYWMRATMACVEVVYHCDGDRRHYWVSLCWNETLTYTMTLRGTNVFHRL